MTNEIKKMAKTITTSTYKYMGVDALINPTVNCQMDAADKMLASKEITPANYYALLKEIRSLNNTLDVARYDYHLSIECGEIAKPPISYLDN